MEYVYIINYQVANVDSKNALKSAIKSARSWFNYFENSWIIVSKNNLTYWNSKLSKLMKQDDYLLILEINIENYNGWMPKDAWDWLKIVKNIN
jgi:predicted NAD/FAD-binding protein